MKKIVKFLLCSSALFCLTQNIDCMHKEDADQPQNSTEIVKFYARLHMFMKVIPDSAMLLKRILWSSIPSYAGIESIVEQYNKSFNESNNQEEYNALVEGIPATDKDSENLKKFLLHIYGQIIIEQEGNIIECVELPSLNFNSINNKQASK